MNRPPYLNEIVLEWEDRNVPSLNEWYSGTHWSKRKKLKDKWFIQFMALLRKNKKQLFSEYDLTIYYHSNLDPSNTITVIKFLEDTMKKDRWIHDDSPKYCKGLHIIPDLGMKKFTYKAVIKRHG